MLIDHNQIQKTQPTFIDKRPVMKENCNVLIIGAGIIGCCLAHELSKRGYQTLNLDFQSSAGAGSTANSCGNVRFYYSTRDGVAIAYESAWYWHNWAATIEAMTGPGRPKAELATDARRSRWTAHTA